MFGKQLRSPWHERCCVSPSYFCSTSPRSLLACSCIFRLSFRHDPCKVSQAPRNHMDASAKNWLATYLAAGRQLKTRLLSAHAERKSFRATSSTLPHSTTVTNLPNLSCMLLVSQGLPETSIMSENHQLCVGWFFAGGPQCIGTQALVNSLPVTACNDHQVRICCRRCQNCLNDQA